MSHIAIQETLDGNAVDWMEKVSDEQYWSSAPAAQSLRRGKRAGRCSAPSRSGRKLGAI
jgi:hypothetical protein